MKIRTGFVSNSSSSSFVCELCGRKETGMDLCLSEAEMFECINGHTICVEEMIEEYDLNNVDKETKISLMLDFLTYDEEKYEKIKSGKFDNKEFEKIWDYVKENIEGETDYNVPEKYCPICQMIDFSSLDLSLYLQKKTGYTKEQAFAKVKESNKRRKVLYDNEYVMFAIQESGLQMSDIIEEIKDKFKTYKEFRNHIKS